MNELGKKWWQECCVYFLCSSSCFIAPLNSENTSSKLKLLRIERQQQKNIKPSIGPWSGRFCVMYQWTPTLHPNHQKQDYVLSGDAATSRGTSSARRGVEGRVREGEKESKKNWTRTHCNDHSSPLPIKKTLKWSSWPIFFQSIQKVFRSFHKKKVCCQWILMHLIYVLVYFSSTGKCSDVL